MERHPVSVKSRLAAATVLAAAVAAVAYPAATAVAADRDTGVIVVGKPADAAPAVAPVPADGAAGTPGRADHDTRPGRPGTTVRQVLLPDGSRARLTSGNGPASVTVTHGGARHTIDASRPSAELDRLHLRILGADSTHPTLRAQLDGSRLPNYYDFASGSLRHTLDGTDLDRLAATGDTIKDYRKAPAAGHTTHAAHPGDARAKASQDVQVKDRAHAKPPHDTSGNPVKRVVEAGQVIKASHDAGEVGTPVIVGGIALLAAGGAYGVRVALRRNGRSAD